MLEEKDYICQVDLKGCSLFLFPFIEKIGCKSIFDWKVIRIPLSMHRSGTDTSTFTKLVILRRTNIQITIYLDDMILRTKQ